MKTILGIFFAIFGLGIILMIYQESRDAYFVDRIRFQSEFGQPADIRELSSLARKNRELAVWEKIRNTAQAISEDETNIKIILQDLKTHRDPEKVKEMRGRADKNSQKLVRQLELAWKFGQFENTDHTSTYGFLKRMIEDDSLMNEREWYNVFKSIEGLRP